MKRIVLYLLCLMGAVSVCAQDTHEQMLFNSLSKNSISELFAFHSAYPDSELGEQALDKAWSLINLHRLTPLKEDGSLQIPDINLMGMLSLINAPSNKKEHTLSEKHLLSIQNFSDHLGNRKLKGYNVWDRETVLALPREEIDLARALLLFQYEEDDPELTQKILQFEASLDLMALQILAYLPPQASDIEKINTINHFIFFEQGFRFPPHSLYAKDIDTYTFLSSVLDSRQGVCLGVSILYLSLAQRLLLPLEIITPPGHIYIRYKGSNGYKNIETTARGIHIPSHRYLSINTRSLQKRHLKEVVGLAFMNQAAVFWHRNKHKEATALYEKAALFITEDPLLKLFLGYNYLFSDQEAKGRALLKQLPSTPFEHACTKERAPEDFLQGKIDIESLKVLYESVDETRESVVKKQQALEVVTKKFPLFREGHYHLATCYLQLSQLENAYQSLMTFHKLDNTHPTVEYYLAILCMKTYRYKQAWQHFYTCQKALEERQHAPYCLKELAIQLRFVYPDPKRHQVNTANDAL